ncbi:MAG: AlpA family phage regulatory protein [Gammaproteobacteria bacterium]|nr:AlpA family phage regulatory protein [Gammaproteobacteria bacterium]
MRASGDDRLLRYREVMEMTGLSRNAIFMMVRRGDFPPPIRIGPKALRWRKSVLDEFLDSCPRATGEAA